MTWHMFNIPVEKVIGGESSEIQNTIGQILEFATGVKRDRVAVFNEMLIDGSLNIYLSPEVSKVIKSDLSLYEATSCLDPSLDSGVSKDKLKLSFGNPEILENFIN